MKKWIAVMTVLCLMLTLTVSVGAKATCDLGDACPTATFSDVKVEDWFHDEVDAIVQSGIMNGMSETKFGPQLSFSRAMMATILYRLDKEPAVTGETGFTDVGDSWYTDAVIWAEQNKIIRGIEEDLFGPDYTISREQMATMMYRYAAYKYFDTSAAADLAFKDADKVSDWAEDAMKWAVAEGIFQGDDSNNVNPGVAARRCEAAAVILRFTKEVYVEYDAVVETAQQLKDALAQGGEIAIVEDVELDDVITLTKDTTITLTADVDASAVTTRPLEITGKVNLTINGGKNKVVMGNYGLLNITDDSTGTITVNGGIYEGKTDNGSFIKPRGNKPLTINLNDVTVTDASENGGYIMDASSHSGFLTVNIQGGTFTSYNGLVSIENLNIDGAAIDVRHVAIEANRVAQIKNCTIKVANTGTATENAKAPSAAISAGNNAVVTVQNCVLDSGKHAFAVYTSGGIINATECTIINGTNAIYHQHDGYPQATFAITMDGQVPDGILYPNCADAPCTLR